MSHCSQCGAEIGRGDLCMRCYQKKYRAEHRERCKQLRTDWMARNSEKYKETVRRYQKNHPEQIKESHRKYYEKQKAKRQPRKKKESEKCRILKKHIETLKDDPNRLSTAFIQKQETILKRNRKRSIPLS